MRTWTISGHEYTHRETDTNTNTIHNPVHTLAKLAMARCRMKACAPASDPAMLLVRRSRAPSSKTCFFGGVRL